MNTAVNRKGFTIVELLIVIVVIGILAAITIVAYNGLQQRARDAQRQSDFAYMTTQHLAARHSSQTSNEGTREGLIAHSSAAKKHE